MKRTLYAAGTALCLLLLLIVILCAAVTHLGRDGELYARCFHAFADTRALGLPTDAYDGIGQALGDYFSGEAVDFPYFNAREKAHLADIQALFRLFDRAWLLVIPAAAIAFWLLKKRDFRGFLLGCGCTAVLLGALAAYIAVDFEGAFLLMHRLLFTNELWLLNPQTDLLICLMPEAMFIYLAGRLALLVIPAWLLIPTLIILGGTIKWNRSRCAP